MTKAEHEVANARKLLQVEKWVSDIEDIYIISSRLKQMLRMTLILAWNYGRVEYAEEAIKRIDSNLKSLKSKESKRQ